jgi:hypothetical protein
VAAKGRRPHTTCSFLEIGEKQIQIEYDQRINKTPDLRQEYPSVVNMTYLNHVTSYVPPTGLPSGMFYYPQGDDLPVLLNKSACLEAACQNVGFFATGRPPQTLHSIFENISMSP